MRRACPECGSTSVVVFDADEDWCTQCKTRFPGESFRDDRDRELTQLRAALAEAMRFCCLKDGDGDFLNEHLAVRIRDYIKSAEASTLPSTYEQGAESAGPDPHDVFEAGKQWGWKQGAEDMREQVLNWLDSHACIFWQYGYAMSYIRTLPTHPPLNAESEIGNGGAAQPKEG